MSSRKTSRFANSYSNIHRRIKAQVAADMLYIHNSELARNSISDEEHMVSSDLQNLSGCRPTSNISIDTGIEDVNIFDMPRPMEYVGVPNDFIREHESMSSDSEGDLQDIFESTLCDQLSLWVVENHISMTATGSLLSILKKFHKFLPSDPRTLLKTPVNCTVRSLNKGGEYCHAGIGNGIKAVLKGHQLRLAQVVEY